MVLDSFEVIIEGTELCTVGCFRVAVLQVIVLNLGGKMKPESEPLLWALDSHNSESCCDPFDVALDGGCVIASVGECFDFLEYP